MQKLQAHCIAVQCWEIIRKNHHDETDVVFERASVIESVSSRVPIVAQRIGITVADNRIHISVIQQEFRDLCSVIGHFIRLQQRVARRIKVQDEKRIQPRR